MKILYAADLNKEKPSLLILRQSNGVILWEFVQSIVVAFKSENVFILCFKILAHVAEVLLLLCGTPFLSIAITVLWGCSQEFLELGINACKVLSVQVAQLRMCWGVHDCLLIIKLLSNYITYINFNLKTLWLSQKLSTLFLCLPCWPLDAEKSVTLTLRHSNL